MIEPSSVRPFDKVLHFFARILPGARTTRPFVHRLRGIKIDKDVWIGDDVVIDVDGPGALEIHENAGLQLRTIILIDTQGTGKVIIEKEAFIGCGSVITCPKNCTLTIGEGAVISAGSIISSSIPPFSFITSRAAKTIAKVTVPFYENVSYDEFVAGLVPISKRGLQK